MTKKIKLTDSVGKQEDQVAQTKFGLASVGPKSPRSVNGKEVTQGKKGDVVAKEKNDEEEFDLNADAGVESAADPIVLAQAETGAATDATAGSASSAAGSAGAEAGAAAGSGAAAGGAAAGAVAISGATLGLVSLGAIGIAAAAFGGGGGGAAAASAAGFAISGTIALGKITNVTGLTVEAYKADGMMLSTTSSVVNADGTYRIDVSENYTGAILVRLVDSNATTNYFDEGTGAAKDIATDLRAVVYAAAGNGATVTVMLTPLTELAVRQLVGDTGGDAGASVKVLGASVAAVTQALVDDANNAVETAFGLSDIVATAPVTVDNLTGTVNDYGQVLAAISGLEKVQSDNTGQPVDTSQILNQLSLAIVTPATGSSTLSQSAVDMLVQGAEQVQTAAAAAPTLYAANTATTLATALTTAIGTSVTGLTLVGDPGNDFITNSTAAQTITAELDAALGTNKLWGSLDNGATWTEVTNSVADVAGTPTLTWSVGALTGTNVIKLAQTASTVAAFNGATTDLIANTKVAVQSYTVDTAAPAAPSVAVVAADATATEASAGAVTVNAEKLSTVAVTFAGTAGNVTKTITGSGAVQAVALTTGELTTLGEGAVGVSAVATDIAGNASAAGTGSFNLDTVLPSFTSATTANFAENTATAAYTATATDANTVTYSLGGADAALFSIDAATGAVTFKASPNFEAPFDAGANNVYDLTVTATDVAGNASSQAVAITVTNVNEMPTLTSGTAASFAENATGTVYTAAATDADAGATLTYALGGTDAALFAINASTGAVTFAMAPNFEVPADAGGDNVYNVTVTASDGANTTTPQAVAITVTGVNEAPTSIPATSSDTIAVNQAFSANISDLFSDVDAGNVFSYSATGLPTGITLNSTTGAIGGTPTATGTATIVFTATDSGGLTASHTVTVNVVSAPAISTIAANVTQAQSGNALTFNVGLTEAVTVVTTGGVPTLTLDVGGTPMTATYASGTGTNTLTFTATTPATGDSSAVAVTAINLNGGTITGNTTSQALVTTSVGQTVASFAIDNSNPAFTSGAAASFAENGTGAAYASAVTDVTAVAYTLGGTDAALFSINSSTGAVTFATAPNFEVPADAGGDNVHNVTVTATDALGHVSNQPVAITVTNVNEAPALTSGASANFAENGTGTVYTAAATDPEGAALTYALAGTDAARFNINASTGAVTFAATPNFEAPADTGGNNVYDITVTASDGTNTTSAQAVAITVTNVNETPTLTSGTAASFAENGTGTAYTAAATDPEGAALTYALGGTDAALFNINSTTGAVTFATAPNFEVPADAGGDNVYNVTVTASDGTNTTTPQAVAITVTGVNEAPTVTASPPSTQAFVVNQAIAANNDVTGLFTDVDGGTLTYSQTGLPTGVTLNSVTGLVSGTPTTTGTTSVTFTATDAGGLSASHTIAVSIVSAPTLTSTIDNVTNFEVTSDIVLTASENVTAVAAKYIHIINDGGAGFHGEATTNTQDILVTDATKVTITNNTITINPGFDLDFANDYHIMVDDGAFLGVTSGQGSVATTDAAAMNFSTVLPSASATATASQAMGGADAMVAGHSWWDAEGVGTAGNYPGAGMGTPTIGQGNYSTTAVARDFVGEDYALAFTDYGAAGIQTNDFSVLANNFAVGDLIYTDNKGDNVGHNPAVRQGDFDGGIITDNGAAPTYFSFGTIGTSPNVNGGELYVTLEGSTASFADTAALQVLLGSVTYQPVLYG